MSGTDFDVVQIGYGPVGQTFAALAGQLGCKVGVYERYPSLYGLPRAGHIDHEIMRIFQSIGCAATIEQNALRSNKYEWRNAAGQVLLDFEWNADGISGWPSDYLIFQPDLEDALDDIVRSTPTISVNFGWEAVGIIQFPDHVELTVRDAADPRMIRKVTARYLVAADGGNSFARKALGIDWRDLGFSQPWLVVDFRQKRPLSLPFENGQICDPARPMCLFQLGKAHRRFSYMVMPGEEEWAKQPDTAWSLVRPWVGPDDVELIRQATYVFESKLLDNWRVDRTLFMGDSAHVMPPFLGQGMCSGIRDAANLAWKLALVLAGRSGENLLDSYCSERKPHVAGLIRLSVEVGRITCTTDRNEARGRDEALLAGKRPPAAHFPGLVDGILMSGANAVEAALVGRLGPQGRIELDRKAGRADDLLGPGWQLIALQDPRHGLSIRSRAMLDRIDAKILHFDGPAGVVDADGVYARFFDANGVSAILVRPDFYIYCAAQTPDRLNASFEQLERMLSLSLSAAEVRTVCTTSAA
jgi:2-polyprenyl-6-methoxyphenol hydroxylase-like FAD-dependent oxidoreductase